jgi:hypothetical protein
MDHVPTGAVSAKNKNEKYLLGSGELGKRQLPHNASAKP